MALTVGKAAPAHLIYVDVQRYPSQGRWFLCTDGHHVRSITRAESWEACRNHYSGGSWGGMGLLVMKELNNRLASGLEVPGAVT